jgi:hypothetical protein
MNDNQICTLKGLGRFVEFHQVDSEWVLKIRVINHDSIKEYENDVFIICNIKNPKWIKLFSEVSNTTCSSRFSLQYKVKYDSYKILDYNYPKKVDTYYSNYKDKIIFYGDLTKIENFYIDSASVMFHCFSKWSKLLS